jgi:beta-glucosidase
MDSYLETQVKQLLSRLTLEEKISLMYGDPSFWQGLGDMTSGGYNAHLWSAGFLPKKGIVGILFTDGPRGIILKGSTAFPVAMARGASWDVELEELVGEVIGKELRANGGTLFGGVCINLPRHPAWGRAQESYSEDTLLLGKMGVALSKGVQKYAMACVKHFALNSMENSRYKVDVQIDERALHEIYLAHFKRVVDSGAACVMSAYNKMNGEYCGQNKVLLNDILKNKWGFEGFVITDFIFGIRDAKKAVLAGQDVEMPFPLFFHRDLKNLVESGELAVSRINDAVSRIISQQLKFIKPVDFGMEVNGCESHRKLAREVAEKSMVLLKNEDNILPLKNTKSIAVIGRLADMEVTGDGGSSNTQPSYVITPLKGIRNRFEKTAKVTFNDASNISSALECAKEAEIVIIIAGYTHDDEGEYIPPDLFKDFKKHFPEPISEEDIKTHERMFLSGNNEDVSCYPVGGDRKSLSLRQSDIELINEIVKVNKNTIVSIIAGSTVLMEEWRDKVPAIIMQWYAGMEGGNALASLLAGDVNPSGKLPFVVPTSTEHLPYFDSDAKEITYDLWHGYRKLDKDENKPAFPFGFGLSYTTFLLKNLTLDKNNYHSSDIVKASFQITNTGTLAGEEVVQLYISAIGSKVQRAKKELKAFTKVKLDVGDIKNICIELPISEIAYYDEPAEDFIIEPIKYQVFLGVQEQDEHALRAEFLVI